MVVEKVELKEIPKVDSTVSLKVEYSEYNKVAN
jgi:hypothetical protein